MPDRDCTACGHPWLVHGSVGCLFVDNGVCGCPKRGRWARDVPEPATSGPVRPAEPLEALGAGDSTSPVRTQPQRVRLVGGPFDGQTITARPGVTHVKVSVPGQPATRYDVQPDGTAHAAEEPK